MKNSDLVDQGITIRSLEEKDMERAGDFAQFGNSLIDEDAPVVMDSRISPEEEKKWLEGRMAKVKDQKQVFLFAEKAGEIVGIASVGLEAGRRRHVGSFGVSIRNGCRGVGLGSRLLRKTVEKAKEDLRGLKIVRLRVFGNNVPAIGLYKNCGFKEIARIPEQIFYKGRLVDEIIMLLYV